MALLFSVYRDFTIKARIVPSGVNAPREQKCLAMTKVGGAGMLWVRAFLGERP